MKRERRSIMGSTVCARLLLLAASTAIVGCGQDPNEVACAGASCADGASSSDAPREGSALDTAMPSESAVPGVDTGVDGPVDTGVDAPVDAMTPPADAGIDSPAMPDAGALDAGLDAGSDASADAPSDAPPPMNQVTVGPQGNLTFSPTVITIQRGQTVAWIWASGNHTVTSGVAGVPDNLFCSPNDTSCATAPTSVAGTTYAHTFLTAGTFDYFCAPHAGAGMTGQVVVQ